MNLLLIDRENRQKKQTETSDYREFFGCGSLEKKLSFQFHFKEAKLVASLSADVQGEDLCKIWSKMDKIGRIDQIMSIRFRTIVLVFLSVRP